MGWQQEDHQILLAAVEELTHYLHSTALQWKIQPPLVFTAGRIMLAQKRILLVARDDPGNLKFIESINQVKLQNKAAWQRKIEQEIPYRKTIWQNMLKDYLDEGMDASYSAQITNRVMLALLISEADSVQPAIETSLRELDEALKRVMPNGNFIWDAALEPGFNQSEFWYLYSGRREK
jgi:hypothetical protein